MSVINVSDLLLFFCQLPTMEPSLYFIIFYLFALGTASRKLQIDSIAPPVIEGSVLVQFTAEDNTLDAPHISAVNSTVYDWWYFNAVSADSALALTVVFYTLTDNAFIYIEQNTSDVYVSVSALLPNGTTLHDTIAPANQALIFSGGNLRESASGQWIGANASFWGASDLKTFGLQLDLVQFGIQGELVFESVCP